MMVAYGVGLSWSSALAEIDGEMAVLHGDYQGAMARS